MRTKEQLIERFNTMIQSERKAENFKFSNVIRLKRVIEIAEGKEPVQLFKKEKI